MIATAENPRAVLGGNFPPDEDDAPRGPRVVNLDRARDIEFAARQIKQLFNVPLNRIMEKRKGGEEGRALRRFLIFYARGRGSPVWECAKIFDLNRKQIGQEEDAYLSMLARNPELETDADNMIDMLDAALRVDRARFIRVSLSEIQADAAAKKAIKAAQEAADLLEANAPKPKPKKVKLTESDRLLANGQAKRRREALEGQIRIARAVIEKAKGPKATKEQRKDAEKAERELDAMLAKMERAQ